MDNEERLIRNLISLPKETQWFEFKSNNVNENEIGEYISALGNSATCEEKDRAYLIWGVEDKKHEIVGTTFNPFSHKIGNEELENWLRRLLSSNANFEFTTLTIDGKNVVLFTIQKAINTPITFKKEAYIRSGSYKKLLKDLPSLEIRLWSKLNLAKYELIPAKKSG
ncbi:MAG: ATP-binding protein [Methanocorpusculum sp.]|nr:ATP-binding protein [Methanocorpusculum sp.]